MSMVWLLKKRFLFIIIFSALAACAHPSFTTSDASPSNKELSAVDLAGIEQDILYYVNQHRKSVGLPSLQPVAIASEEADKHSMDMAKKVTAFGHEGFDERITYISKQIGTLAAAAENVAYGELTAQQVVDGWLHSAGHKKNIEGDYSLTGIGVEKDSKGTIFYTQIFLRK